MAAIGFTPISLYYSATAAAVPLAANLVAGELALNTVDGKLYYKSLAGTVTLLASAAGSLGDVVGPASATDNALARFDLTTGKLIQNSVGILSDTGALSGLTDIAASGSITLSGGTANGVAYLNGAKVLTTGSALVFDGSNLGVGVTPSGWTFSSLSIGGQAASFAGDVNTVYAQANAYYNAGWKYVGTGYAGQYQIDRSVTALHKWYTAASGTAGNAISFTQAMTLDSSGNLLVGATSNTGSGATSGKQVLQFNGAAVNGWYVDDTRTSAGTDTGIIFGRGANVIGAIDTSLTSFRVRAIGDLVFAANSTDAARIDTNGNLLVGTTTSNSAKVTISNAGAEAIQFYPGSASNDNQTLHYNRSASVYCSNSIYAADHRFYIGGVEKARIDSSGNLLVGKTSSNNGTNGAQLSPTTQFFTNTNDYIALFNRKGTDGVSIYFQKDETNVGTISVTSIATTYNSLSDYRLKNITGTLTGAKDFIMSLQPKQGTWKADGSKFVGFLAHEFQEVSPSSVTGVKDAVDADGKPIMQAMQASSSEVMANLISLVQEQQALITQLTDRITALEGA